VYNSGRNSRDTLFANGTATSMLFEHTKTFLCNVGVGHWGNNAHLEAAEMHDTRLGAFFFGSSMLHNGLISASSNNPNNGIYMSQDGRTAPYSKVGFQFYDTWIQVVYEYVQFIQHDD
jgi:hypothetical protein